MKLIRCSVALTLFLQLWLGSCIHAAESPSPKPAMPPGATGPMMDEAQIPASFEWLVLSRIPVAAPGSSGQPDEATQKTVFTSDLLAAHGGESRATGEAGRKLDVNGVEREWKAERLTDDAIRLNTPGGKDDFQLAYASTEFDVASDGRAWLGIGSDDGVRVWLNGELVHEHWITRGVQLDDDVVVVPLKAGRNRLLVKVQNTISGWGFSCRLMNAEARAVRLVRAARAEDAAALKDLVGRGLDVNSRTSEGLTPFMVARLAGNTEAMDFLVAKGADTTASLPSPDVLVERSLGARVKAGNPAVVVLVARDGKVLYQKAFGMADVERAVPASLETKFRIGSVTKQFTAAAILHLQAAGKLKISDSLAKYYPDFPGADAISLEQLMTHTSGLHSYTDVPSFIQGVTQPTTNAAIIAAIKKLPPDFKPGERWAYCNSGYLILGDIIEKVSGQEYGDYLKQVFFAPLGMNDSGVYRNDRPPAGAAVGHMFDKGMYGKAMDWDMTWAGGAGALYSTVGDLYRWNEAVFSGKVLSAADRTAAFTPVVTEENKKDKSENGYGYGWGIQQFRGAREVSHGGGLHGFLSSLLRIPERNLTVVVLTNVAPPQPGTAPGAVSREIVELYVGSELGPRVKAAVVEARPISDEAIAAVLGRYDYRGPIMVVTREGQRVFAQLGGQPNFEIFPKSETEFFWKVVNAQVEFVKDESGKVVKAIHHQGGQTLHAPRLDPPKEVTLSDAESDLLLGDYDFKPVGKGTISREGGRLFAQLTGQPKLEVGATSATELFLRGVNARITFVKGDDGKVTKLILHQGGQDVEMPKIVQP